MRRGHFWIGVGVGLTLAGACGGDDGGGGGGAVGADASAEGGSATCRSDADCATGRCDEVDERCVECLFHTDCEGDRRCDGGRCSAVGRCASSLDCIDVPGDRGVCAGGFCVECDADGDCSTGHCERQTCVDGDPCKSSLDCGAREVCDEVAGHCVECLGNEDCDPGATCFFGDCVELSPCKSDRECTPDGKLCDRDLGVCVRCAGHEQCPSTHHCERGACVLDACQPGTFTCDGDSVARCTADGLGFEPMMPCERCVLDDGRGICTGMGAGGAAGRGGAGGAPSGGTAGAPGGAGGVGAASGAGGTAGTGGAAGSSGGGASGVGGAGGTGGVTCPTDTVFCVDRCVDVRSDPANCGNCGIACPPTAACVATRCECPSGLTQCDGECVDTDHDDRHCGACDVACTASRSCEGGSCECDPGLTECGTSCVSVGTNASHCGYCGSACSGTCSSGSCSVPARLQCLPKPSPFSTCNAYCASVGKTCSTSCTGGGAYGRYFDTACTQVNLYTGACTDSISGSSSIVGFRCCCA